MPTFRRVSGMDMALATRQLSTLVGAGIPLVEALGALAQQVETARLKGVLGLVRDRVNEGASLADALAAAGPFSVLSISMVRAGKPAARSNRCSNDSPIISRARCGCETR